ncbi:hypothetical protein KAFR_0G02140 [Kazachstania africana CBS 2517]|uniref:TECPR1-like DysF domain-containing protein n=1 Tax=Kazachstania africana (strain ATCC 22294 / BCRC 22015 / CBS 2517 / CECT 1963 / NBRC 1671 / NRRL Y-8276) TaxID=1071382 RepID=H2AXZ8_KAZAF|nr:hypothetical protein KAFR_0G02140 [Kazachstania africana CBS 2517]CCF59248.1 hypothetical protein KAFR_0G02140 [Kazachstania africana CBS 2517]
MSSRDVIKETEYHARFSICGSRDSSRILTGDVPFEIIKALSNVYPILLILDSWLDCILWTTGDTALNLINLLLVCISLKFAASDTTGSIYEIRNLYIESAIFFVLKLLSFQFLLISSIYYVNSVQVDLNRFESPTVDEIVSTADSVVNKLRLIHSQVTNLIKIENFKELILFCIVLSPLQWILLQFVQLDTYLIFVVAACSLYHSNWIQVTMRVIWKCIYVRMACYKHLKRYISPKLKNITTRQIWKSKMTGRDDLHSVTLRIKNTANINDELIKTLLLNRIGTGESEEYLENVSEKELLQVECNVIEFEFIENQRKWGPNGWMPKLLPYEGTNFTFSSSENKTLYRYNETPIIFQEYIPPNYYWLEDDWTKKLWKYYDTKWSFIGLNDSPECFTRSREWNRRAYSIRDN